MANANNDDLDDLLNFMDEDEAGPVVDETPAPEPEEVPKAKAPVKRAPKTSPEPEIVAAAEPESDEDAEADAYIAQLKAELSKPSLEPTKANGRPVPESQLTEKQKQVRDLKDQLARKKAEELVQAENYEAADGETILIHFLEDGFTACGRVWYKGQELEFEVDGAAYEQTLDRDGNTWLSYADDEMAQIQAYGKLYFRKGPWPGIRLDEDQISTAERRRNRAAPIAG